MVLADGSGISRYNLNNADTTVRLLAEVYREPDTFALIYGALPVAGREGALAKRMVGTAAEGNLRGRAGTMSGLSTIFGYLHTAQGEPLAFSMAVQNYAGPSQHAREVLDRIAATLCESRRQ